MRKIETYSSRGRRWSMALLLGLVAVVVAGCGGGGGRDPILGSGGAAIAIAPTVTATVPAAQSPAVTGVAINRKITATFSEAMDPATLATPATTFTLTGPGATPVPGTVTYIGTTALFTPASLLAASTTFTATITTGAKNLAGIALASNFVWSFTTGTTTDTTAPTVTSTVPVDLATGVPVNQEITAIFSEPMDPFSITSTTFTLMQGLTPVAGKVNYANGAATFAPSSLLAQNTTYTALVTSGAKDLADNALAGGGAPNPWTFTTASTLPLAGPAQVDLGCAANFAILAGSTVTNTGPTIVNGDLGLSPGSAVTGFPPGTVTGGAIRINDTLANNAKLCLTTAYNDAAGRSTAPITVAGNIGGQTLAPGLYKSTSTLAISSGDLTLAGNGVWIFQIASTLTTTAGRQVILTGGALASNVFWQVGTSATLGTTSSFKGTIMADQSITLNTGATLDGRALTRIGAVSLDSNSVTKP
ncbi:MAG: ice-binding family protein [Polaromonas sp.]